MDIIIEKLMYSQMIREAEPETKTMAKEVIQAAGGEEAYWNGMKSSYKESLSIDKYIAMEKSKFLSQEGLKETDSNADDLWEKYYSKLLKKLVQSENVR